MSQTRSVSYDLVSLFRWLTENPARGRRVAERHTERSTAAQRSAAVRIEEAAKTVRKAMPVKPARQVAVPEKKHAEGKAKPSREECEEVLAACIEESLAAEGYVASRTMVGDLPAVEGNNMAGERVVVTLDGNSASYELEGFKGSSCADLSARLDAQMASRGLVAAEESAESKAPEEVFGQKAQERRQRCPKR